MSVEECVEMVRQYIEEGHIPSLAADEELRERFMQEFMETCKRAYEEWERSPEEQERNRQRLLRQLGIEVSGAPPPPPALRPCPTAFWRVCTKLMEELNISSPDHEFVKFERWLIERSKERAEG